MKERPILFSGEMVRALLAGTKTQTRRVVKGVPMFSADYDRQWHPHVLPPGGSFPDEWTWWEGPSHGPSMYHSAPCPFGQRGDRLWVRETHAPGADQWGAWGRRMRDDAWGPPPVIYYAADGGERPFIERWRPSIHMPRWACRLVLEITDVRIERLKVISEGDCCAEGVGSPITRDYKQPKFQALWERVNGAGSWDKNPWVWVLTFRRVEATDAH